MEDPPQHHNTSLAGVQWVPPVQQPWGLPGTAVTVEVTAERLLAVRQAEGAPFKEQACQCQTSPVDAG